MTQLETSIGYIFKNKILLQQALTHPSVFSNQKQRLDVNHFERLEFMGDRILSLIIGTWLYQEFHFASEGELSRRLAGLVRKETLATVAEKMTIHTYIKYSRANDNNAAQWQTFLSDACEALIGAIYLDGGLSPCEQLVKRFWGDLIHAKHMENKDPKTLLQEYAQAHLKIIPKYTHINQEGPSHAPQITIQCTLGDNMTVTATASNKKAATTDCAKQLIALLNIEN